MKVNLTLLVRNRPRLTLQTLSSLGPMTDEMNLTILDDRSDQETVDLLDRVINERCVVIRNEEAMGTGALRNKVIEISQRTWGRGNHVYLSDNDVLFLDTRLEWFGKYFSGPTWFDVLIQCYEKAWGEGFRVIGAYGHPFHRPIGQPLHIFSEYRVQEVQALATQSMLLRWEVWDKYGPFCDTPIDKVCQSEDVDFTNRIRADGFKLGVVSPALLVSTGITNTFGEKIPGWQAVAAQAPSGVVVE